MLSRYESLNTLIEADSETLKNPNHKNKGTGQTLHQKSTGRKGDVATLRGSINVTKDGLYHRKPQGTGTRRPVNHRILLHP